MAVAVAEALEAARGAAIETADDAAAVGAVLGSHRDADGIHTFRFQCTLPGYAGWEWVVDVIELDGEATVCESALLPGTGALLAPTWVPWSERVRPGDLEPGMILPYIAEDPRLVPGYTETGDEDRDALAIFEFGLGRERVLAPEARNDAADRWSRGSHGPNASSAIAAGAACATCAFVVPLAGSLRLAFGVCANEWSPADGKVVAYDHGCGAHSQTDAERRLSEWPSPDPVIDTAGVETFDLTAPDEPEPAAEAAVAEDAVAEDAVAEDAVPEDVVPEDAVTADDVLPLEDEAE